MIGVLKRRENRDMDTHTHMGRTACEGGAEIAVICLQTKERQGFPVTPEARSEA